MAAGFLGLVLGAEERLLPPVPPLGDVVGDSRGYDPCEAHHGKTLSFPLPQITN
jgi:hypothetical protein